MELNCSAIQKRYSCRLFDDTKEVPLCKIEQLIYAASLAPSGKNLQPWKFKIVKDKKFGDFLSELLPNNGWIKNHEQFICAFLDADLSYNKIKDCMSIAAAIENLLIEAASCDINTCWIGECTQYCNETSAFFQIDSIHQLVAIIAVGYAKRKVPVKRKKSLQDIII